MPETEREYENALRPLSFESFSGQPEAVENLKVFVAAARMRQEALDHVLLHGPPGLGKTTLSNIISNELDVGFKVTSGPVLDKPGDLAGLLTSLEKNDVLFIDEIHRLSPIVEEYLYSAMEDYRIDILIDKGPSPFDSDRPCSVHAYRSNDTQRPADRPASGPLWDQSAPRILRHGDSDKDYPSQRQHPEHRLCCRCCSRDRRPKSRYAPYCQRFAATCTGLCSGKRFR